MRDWIRKISPVLVIISGLAGCGRSARVAEPGRPENVIILIGDGMGVAHMTLGHLETGGLNAGRMPVGGFLVTFPHGGLVTDSAASGTALATGRKTRNGMIGISPEGDTLMTVLERAEEAGMATGLVATSSITHATPASFAAHVESRRMETEIAMQISRSGVDVLIGGGWSFFAPAGAEGSRRTDGQDPAAVLRERMPVLRSLASPGALEGATAAAVFLAPAGCPPAGERDWSLADISRAAIEILDRSRGGFFLMIEGSQIDWAAHDGDEKALIEELKDFDGAVGAALDFAERDGNTLVIMTADHETGGLALLGGPEDSSLAVVPDFSTGSHTMSMVPLLAFGPGSQLFGGIHDNTYIGAALIEILSR